MSVSIDLENVGLVVPAYRQAERSARSLFGGLLSAAFDPPQRTQRVLLDGIDLHVGDGERVAVLGGNGAGKSTLLRVIAGAYTPSSGSVRIAGRMQALLNVSLGFNVDATVRENIYLRGAAMGMSIREVHALAPSVLEFAGLAERAGDRLRVLSAGQRMRLSFSITTIQQTDIMVMDEWIGTGDADFLEKARSRLMGRVDSARLVLLASHNVPLLMQVCDRAIYLQDGRIVGAGALLDVVGEFIPHAMPARPAPPRAPLTEAEIEAMRVAHRAAAREAKVREVRAEMERTAREAQVAAARAAMVEAARTAQIETARAAARAAMVEAARAAQVEAARAAKVAALREENQHKAGVPEPAADAGASTQPSLFGEGGGASADAGDTAAAARDDAAPESARTDARAKAAPPRRKDSP